MTICNIKLSLINKKKTNPKPQSVQRTGNCLETYDLTIYVYFIIAPKRL